MGKRFGPFDVDINDEHNREACRQGLTLVHFSAQRKHFLWDTLGTFSTYMGHTGNSKQTDTIRLTDQTGLG